MGSWLNVLKCNIIEIKKPPGRRFIGNKYLSIK